MKIAPTTIKLGALFILATSMVLTGCTGGIRPEAPTDDAGTESESDHSNTPDDNPRDARDFTYVTEDGTVVQCISVYRGLSCDWEGAERHNPDAEDSDEKPSGKED